MKVKGRYPNSKSVLKPENIIINVEHIDDNIIIRLDDEENIDFWMEIKISDSDIKKIFKQKQEEV